MTHTPVTHTPVTHNPGASRFEAAVPAEAGGAELAVLEYDLRGNVMALTHTFVPGAARGRGLAGALTEAALAHARAQGYTVAPRCSFAAAHIARHPEHRALLR